MVFLTEFDKGLQLGVNKVPVTILGRMLELGGINKNHPKY